MDDQRTGSERKLEFREIVMRLPRVMLYGLPKLVSYSVRKSFREHPFKSSLKAAFVFGFLGLFVGAIHRDIEDRKQNRYDSELTELVSFTADRLGDDGPGTTGLDWARAYAELDVPYDVHNPIQLTVDQKEMYLTRHGVDFLNPF